MAEQARSQHKQSVAALYVSKDIFLFSRRFAVSHPSQTAVCDLPQEKVHKVFGLSERTIMLSEGRLRTFLRHASEAQESSLVFRNFIMLIFFFYILFLLSFLAALAISQLCCKK